MKIRLTRGNWDAVECDALILPLFEDENIEEGLSAELDEKLDGLLGELKSTDTWKGKAGEIETIHRPNHLKTSRLILLGVGKKETCDSGMIRNMIMKSIQKVKTHNLRRIMVCLHTHIDQSLSVQAAVEGLFLGVHGEDQYKTSQRSRSFVQEILLSVDQQLEPAAVERATKKGMILAQTTNLARTWVNEPGNRMNPTLLAEKAREVAREHHLEIQVFSESEMEELGMEAVLAVARGSDEPARFVLLKHMHSPKQDARPIVFIGKGVTFDSGGLSLKPSQSMEEMKSDKAGACAVLAAMQAIAQLQLKKNVIGIIPAVENLPSGRAQRPGDVIRSMSGKTIEVVNTDAEGRLILADALFYAQRFKPQYIVDIATLTGACVVALGHLRAGVFSNSEALYEKLLRASKRSGEKFWRLPLDKEYCQEIESHIADVKNVGSRWGGAITAAKFLEEFVGDFPWCHIDMAGVDLFTEDRQQKSPSGFGVRTLVEMATDD